MENIISQVAFNQKLFFPEKRNVQLLFSKWYKSSTRTGRSYDGNFSTLCYNIGNFIDSLSGVRNNPGEQVAQSISKFFVSFVGFQNVPNILLQDFEDLL